MAPERGPVILLLSLLMLFACAGTAAAQSPQTPSPVTLAAKLTPERLGAGTTIVFDLKIHTPRGATPRPVSAIDLLFPAGVGLIDSGLGLATCAPATLEALGPSGCPPDALMGRGRAQVDIPVGPETIGETGYITTWLAPVQEGHVAMLFFAEGRSPIAAQLIFTSELLEAGTPYGGSLNTTIPPIPSLPDAPNAAIVQMHATIGPEGITYYTRARHRRVAYRPDGLRLPRSCPRGGFPFAVVVGFSDGGRALARAFVSCPR